MRRTEVDAKALRETFMDRPASRKTKLKWSWPKQMIEAGSCEAVMYTSDKWRDEGDYQDYKHVAEGPQTIYVKKGFLADHTGKEIVLCGPVVEVVTDMPDTIAMLAPILGVQCRLYDEGDDGEAYLPSGNKNLYQVDIKGAKLGAAKHPDTGETFLVVYTENEGVLCMITGTKLDVLKDGIVG